MSTATPTRRKQLSEQIDRLNAMLDGLAEGLNDASPTPPRRRPGGRPRDPDRPAR